MSDLHEIQLRFDDGLLFLQFVDLNLRRGFVDVQLPTGASPGAAVTLLVHPPGGVPPLRPEARLVHRAPSGAARLRCTLDSPTTAWLDGYTAALRPLRPSAESPVDPDDPRALAARLDDLSYYELLGVHPDAAPAEVQEAFHALSRQYHPDLFHGLEAERRQRIGRVYRRLNEAYSVLRSPARRLAYDRGLAGPRHRWRLRWSDDAPEVSGDAPPPERPDRSAWYLARAKARLAQPRPRHAPPDGQAIRLLRLACALEPEREALREALRRALHGDLPAARSPAPARSRPAPDPVVTVRRTPPPTDPARPKP